MASEYISKTWEKMSRKQRFQENVMETPLNRCLGTFSLMMLGVGGMVATGLYVVMGEITCLVTGPAIFLSFLVAGIASALSAWCYSEFGARVPMAGSAYIYASMTLGEFAAYIVGWNIVLEHIISIAAVSRGLMGYINAITSNSLNEINKSMFGSSFDFDIFSAVPIIIALILVALGVKSSTRTNNCLTFVNLSIGLFIIILAIIVGSLSNWSKSTTIDGIGTGFLPYGYASIFKGAALTYYAFLGYDIIAISSEECKNPGRSIPKAMAGALTTVSILYIGVSLALTLLMPTQYINGNSSFSSALEYAGVAWAIYPVSVGALAAISCALLGTLFAMPRCIYAMARDGLLFPQLATITESTQVPVLAAVLGSILAIIIAFLFSLDELVEMTSIGTLLAYLIVALSIIVLRYSPIDPVTGKALEKLVTGSSNDKKTEETSLVTHSELQNGSPNNQTLMTNQQVTTIFIFLFVQCALCVTLMWVFEIYEEWWYMIILVILLTTTIGSVVYLDVISTDNGLNNQFRVPLVPYFPCFSVFINSYFMMQLKWMTWVRFIIWTVIGLAIYFFYGIGNSTAGSALNDNHKTDSNEDT